MLDAARIRALPRLKAPVLTAYLDTNPATPRNQSTPPGYFAWLKARARVLEDGLPEAERASFREHVDRLERHLRRHPPRHRAVVAFSGAGTWELLPLQVAVEDELHWGPPALTQLFWLLDEHQPSGIVVLSRSGARFIRAWLGEVVEDEREAFTVDRSDWRRKDLVEPSHAGLGKRRGGAHRDRFAARMKAQYDRLGRGLAARLRRWAERHGLRPVLLAGPAEMVDAILAALPEELRQQTALLKENLSYLSSAELHARLEPVLDQWKRDQEAARVEALLGSDAARRAVGVDETLAQVQAGRVRELVIARGIAGTVRQCERCGRADRAAGRVCPSCGGARRRVPARIAIPDLARRHGVSIDVVAGPAARRLRDAGGVGAWLGPTTGTRTRRRSA
jgi:hypothetical protein